MSFIIGWAYIFSTDSLWMLFMVKHPDGPDTAIWSEHETLILLAGIYFRHLWDNAELMS